MDAISSTVAKSELTGSGISSATLADNFDTFLTLLTTQLKNQDPLEPMDTKEFVQELTQFTAVEQAIQTNNNLEQLLTLQQTSQTSASVSYLGKAVEATGDVNVLKDGQASWRYELSESSHNTSLLIEDQFGSVVYVQPGSTSAGSHDFTWDGNDNEGNPLPDGSYRLVVGAIDVQNTEIPVTTYISGTVDAVRSDPSGAILFVGDVEIPMASVIRVTEPKTADAALNTETDLFDQVQDAVENLI